MANRFGENSAVYDLSRVLSLAKTVDGGNGDGTYLRLDATNDPVTGALDIKIDSAAALRVLSSTNADAFHVDVTNATTWLTNRLQVTAAAASAVLDVIAPNSALMYSVIHLYDDTNKGWALTRNPTTNDLWLNKDNAYGGYVITALAIDYASGRAIIGPVSSPAFSADAQDILHVKGHQYTAVKIDGTTHGQLLLAANGVNQWSIYSQSDTILRFYKSPATPGDVMTLTSAGALSTLGTVTSKPAGTAGIALDANAATGNFTLSLSPANLTANRRVSFPDADGTAALLQVANTYTIGPQTIGTGADANKGLIVKRNSATQTENLQEWQSSAGALLSGIYPDGGMQLPYFRIGDAGLGTWPSSSSSYIFQSYSTGAAYPFNVVGHLVISARSDAQRDIVLAGGSNICGVFKTATGRFGVGTNTTGWISAPATTLHAVSETSTNGAVVEVARFESRMYTSAGGTAGFGAGISLYSESGTNGNYNQLAQIDSRWTTATTASRVSDIVFSAVNATALNERMRISGDLAVTITSVSAAAGVSAMLGLTALGSGANGDGGSILLNGKSSTTAAQSMGALKWLWVDATHASRKAKLQLTAYDTAERLGITVEASGTQALTKIGDGATNYLQINGTGDLLLVGTAKYERHIQIPATPSGTVAQQMDNETYGTAVGLQASSSVNQYAGCQWEVPDDWDGTDVYFEIDWLPNSGAMSGTDTVEWVVEYRAIAEGEVITTGTVATMTATVSDDLSQGQTKHSRMTMTYNNSNQPLTVQDHVYFLVHRNTGVANDFSGTAFVTAYEIIYNSNGFPASN